MFHIRQCQTTPKMSITKSSVYKLNNGLTIPTLGFGLYKVPKKSAFETTYKALETGYRLIDSASLYNNEKEASDAISQFLKDNSNVSRKDISFTTKIHYNNLGYDKTQKAIDDSLKRVSSIGYIDLLLLLAPFANKEKRLESYKALQDSVEVGNVKSIGVSNYGTKHLDEIYSWDGLTIKPVVNQVELHPWLPRKDLQEYAKKNDFLLEAFAPLAHGSKLKDPEIIQISKKHGVTPAQVLLRWSYDQGFIVLSKSINPDRMKQNFDILDTLELDDEDIKILDKDSYEVSTWDPTVYKG